MIVSGFGEQSAALAGRVGDGYFGTAPKRELLDTFAASGGRGPRYAQLTMCWADDADTARKRVHEIWPNARTRARAARVINLLGGPRTEEEAGAVIDDRDREEHAAPGRGPYRGRACSWLEGSRLTA